ncbi:hypothetical protein FRC02_004432 [Tulasnella sp. 418]|nr:hypothetical protein FRC02_004432 [Tulasnella sp. 418]
MENGQQSTPSDSKSSPASIAGATVGSLALFSIIVFIIWWFRKGRRRVTKASKGTMVDLSAPSRPRQSQNGFTQQAPSTPPRKGHPLTELLRSVLTQKSQKKSNILAPLTGLSSPYTCPSPHDTEHQDALGRLPTLSHYSAHTGRHHTRSVGQSTSHRSGSSGPPDPRPPGHRTPYLHPILQHQRGHSVDTFTATGSQTGYGTWTGTDGDYTEPWLGTEGGTDAGDQTSLRDTKVIGSTSAHPNLRVSMSSNSHPASPPGLGFPSVCTRAMLYGVSNHLIC